MANNLQKPRKRQSAKKKPAKKKTTAGKKKPAGKQSAKVTVRAVGKNKGGRPSAPKDADGYTPRQRLDHYKALREEIELKARKAELIDREDVIAERRQVAEILNADLMSLGARLSGKLAKRTTPANVKKIIDAEVVDMMTRWKDAGNVESGPNNV
jgi:hypothetical protein